MDLTERFLEELARTLDVEKTIKKLEISREDARGILEGLLPKKRGVYRIYVDGASRGNPGASGGGAVIVDPHGSIVKQLKRYFGVQTNNAAEYMALVLALEEARSMGLKDIKVMADSELVVKQLNGLYRVRSADLLPLYDKVARLLEGFRTHHLVHIPREENARADRLANEAIDGHAR